MRRVTLRRARKLFRLGWSKDRVRAELTKQHRQRRDLRRTGVVRMAEAGVTTPQIAAWAGWSIDFTQRIVDTYLPRRAEVALAGMLIWEASGTPWPTSKHALADQQWCALVVNYCKCEQEDVEARLRWLLAVRGVPQSILQTAN